LICLRTLRTRKLVGEAEGCRDLEVVVRTYGRLKQRPERLTICERLCHGFLVGTYRLPVGIQNPGRNIC
jgi:hypothetical protein